MTHFRLRHGLLSLAIAAFTFPAASAMAADTAPQAPASFSVQSAADAGIRAGARAFKKGDFTRSISLSRAALKGSMSNKRAAIAQSNLCAAYGSMGDMEKASSACAEALTLRPGYAPAIENKAALTVQIAKK